MCILRDFFYIFLEIGNLTTEECVSKAERLEHSQAPCL